MYEFILLQYRMGNLTQMQVHALVPQYLTEEQVQSVLGESPEMK